MRRRGEAGVVARVAALAPMIIIACVFGTVPDRPGRKTTVDVFTVWSNHNKTIRAGTIRTRTVRTITPYQLITRTYYVCTGTGTGTYSTETQPGEFYPAETLLRPTTYSPQYT